MGQALSTDRIAPMELRSGGRGHAIKMRMDALGWGATDLQRESGLSRSQVYRVLEDAPNVSAKSYAAAEGALRRAEEGAEPAGLVVTEQGFVEFEVTGDFGVRVVVKGPIENVPELERSVARLIRDIRASGGEGSTT